MPFKKGDPNINRKGRPKTGCSLSEIARKLAEIRDVTLPDGTKIERKKALIERIWRDALSGNAAAQAHLIKLIDNPESRINLTTDPIPRIMVVEKRSLEEWEEWAQSLQQSQPEAEK